MSLDLTPLGKAIGRLQIALERHGREPADEEVRDSVIQRFEFTYDLAHKMLRRVLAATAAVPEEIAALSFPSLIGQGGKAVWSRAIGPPGMPFATCATRLPTLTTSSLL